MTKSYDSVLVEAAQVKVTSAVLAVKLTPSSQVLFFTGLLKADTPGLFTVGVGGVGGVGVGAGSTGCAHETKPLIISKYIKYLFIFLIV
jgi:hypothetical protein